MKAFYFSTFDKQLLHGDGRDIIVGSTHTVLSPPVMCEHGLHASKRLIDAIKYAPGSILWHVELSGDILYDVDKMCATERKYLDMFDATELLRDFARKQALINVDEIREYCSETEFNTVYEYLSTNNIELRAYTHTIANTISENFRDNNLKSRPSTNTLANIISGIPFLAPSIWYAVRSIYEAATEYEAEIVAWHSCRNATWVKSACFDIRDKFINIANDMLTNMIREATGWDI